MGDKRYVRSALTGLALLGAATAAQAQDEQKQPAEKHRIGYSHSFLDYESKLADGQGQRDTLDLRLNLTDDLRFDALYSRTRYSGKSKLLCDAPTLSTDPSDGDDGDDGDDGECDDDHDFDRHRNQRGRGHRSHGNGHGYGHHHGNCNGGNPGNPGTPGGPGDNSIGSGCRGSHTDIENYLELGLTAELGKGFRVNGGFLYDDNLDARHLFRPWHVEGLGFKLGAGLDLSDDTELGLELRLMDLDPGGTNTRLAARLSHALGNNTHLSSELYGLRDDVRDCREYGMLLALEHALSPDVKVKFGGKLGYEDFHARSPYEDTPAWGLSVGIEGRLCEGVYANVDLGYAAGAVDERIGTVGLNFRW